MTYMLSCYTNALNFVQVFQTVLDIIRIRYGNRTLNLCSAISASELYLNQRTVTYFRNGLRDLNNVFQTAENILKGCDVHLTNWVACFWVIVQYTLHIEQPSYLFYCYVSTCVLPGKKWYCDILRYFTYIFITDKITCRNIVLGQLYCQ
jgi:hypothetical protein